MADDAVLSLPGLAEIEAAAHRLAGHAMVTPLLASPILDARVGARILVKAENLQRTGSFKFRGALNAISSLDVDVRRRGVVAFSSGNHGQGVAVAAQLLRIPATIVMPVDAPAIKIANTRAYGATIVPYDRTQDDREAIADRIAHERGATVVPPFDDARIIAGQGTIAFEIAHQAAQLGHAIDIVIAPCSGGGLVGGIAVAFAALNPLTKVYAAEPLAFDDMRRSLAVGRRVGNATTAGSICDCLLASKPGILPFAIARRHLADSIVVSDDEVRRAMRLAFADLKLVLEPGGAAALAAVLSDNFACTGKTVVVVASGGNVDREVFAAVLERGID